MNLRTRLFLATLPVLVVFVWYNSMHLVERERAQLVGELRARAQSLAALLASNSAYALQTLNPTLLQSNVNSAFLQADVEFVSIEDSGGRVLAHSDPSVIGNVTRNPSPGSEEAGDVTRAAVPVELRGKQLGTVRLGLSTLGTSASVAVAQRHVFVTSVLLLVAVLFLTGFAAHRLTLPLTVIARTADKMAEGYISARVPLRGPDAIRGDLVPLASTFNRMAERLEHRVRAEHEARLMLAQRVSRLVTFTSTVASGDLDQPAPVFTDDELGRLSEDFNVLLARLRDLITQEQSFRDALEKSARELEEAHARLSLADRRKTDFLGVVSHELRTPLTAVKAFAELLLDGVDDPSSRTEFLTIICREAERLTRLINNLLDLSRIDAGRMNWRQDHVSVSRLVRMAVDQVSAAAHDKEVRIDVLVADEREIEGDAERLAQAIHEILQNAVSASEAGSAVRLYVESSEGEDKMSIVVEDRGCGIDPSNHVAIFERFWQVTKPTQGRELERPRGSGLGLPLAKAIVAAHGGSIAVENITNYREAAEDPKEPRCRPEALGRDQVLSGDETVSGGTRFTVILPLRPRELRVASLLPFAERSLGHVVDSSRWRTLLNKLLDRPPEAS